MHHVRRYLGLQYRATIGNHNDCLDHILVIIELFANRRHIAWNKIGALTLVGLACLAATFALSAAVPDLRVRTLAVLLFIVLFAASGIGNGSTFRTIGVIFDRTQAGPVLGWTSAIAAYGAFVAPIVIGEQIKAGTPQVAMYGFAAFYAVCLVLNWWFYLRRGAYVKNP